MGDTPPDTDNPWGLYLYRLTHRAGWSIARLARESGITRPTISEWINKGGGAAGVKIETIVAIARGAADNPVNAFMAAAELIEEEPQDREIGLILASDLTDDEKRRQISIIEKKREQDEERRVEDTQEVIRALGGRAV